MKSHQLLILALFFGCSVYGQTQATATFMASVTIIEPIGITNTSDMNFSALNAKLGGAVILTPDNDRISSGGVKLADGANVSPATFQITGQRGSSFSISLPKGEHSLTNGVESILLKDFTSNLGDSGEFTNETSEIRVGATLDINSGQKPGNYSSPDPLAVTVNYN